MKESRLPGILYAALFCFITVPVSAALVGILPATPGDTDWQAHYDDVADFTWLADTGDSEWHDMLYRYLVRVEGVSDEPPQSLDNAGNFEIQRREYTS